MCGGNSGREKAGKSAVEAPLPLYCTVLTDRSNVEPTQACLHVGNT